MIKDGKLKQFSNQISNDLSKINLVNIA